MSYPPPYGQQPDGGRPPYGQPPYGGQPPADQPPPYDEQPYGVQPQYVQPPYGAQPQYGPPYGTPPPPLGGAPTPPPMTEPPQTMVLAKWAMWIGAFLTMLYSPAALLDMLVIDTSDWDQAGAEISDSGQDVLLVMSALFGFLFSIAFAALWVLIARACTRAQEWARITASILWGLWFITYLCGFIEPTIGAVLVVNTLIVLTGAAALLCLWLPDSSTWFRQHKTPRYYV